MAAMDGGADAAGPRRGGSLRSFRAQERARPRSRRAAESTPDCCSVTSARARDESSLGADVGAELGRCARASDLKRDDLNRSRIPCCARIRIALPKGSRWLRDCVKPELTLLLCGRTTLLSPSARTPLSDGPAEVRRRARELHVLALYVIAAQRKRKLGKAIVRLRLLESVAAENACQQMLVKAAEASRAEGFWKHLGFKRYTGSTDVKSLWDGRRAGNDELAALVALSAAVASPDSTLPGRSSGCRGRARGTATHASHSGRWPAACRCARAVR